MKKGFTLVELLAVIAILSIIVVFAVPNLIKIFFSSKNTLSDIQKNEIKNAVNLYINDYCINPISDNYICPFETSLDSNGIIYVSSGIITLAQLSGKEYSGAGYFDSNEIINNCSGNIIISSGEIDLSSLTCNFSK